MQYDSSVLPCLLYLLILCSIAFSDYYCVLLIPCVFYLVFGLTVCY